MNPSRTSRFGVSLLLLLTAGALTWSWTQEPLQNPVERAWYQALIPAHSSASAQNIVRIDLDSSHPREQLIELLRAISKQKPAAVGLSLDLSQASDDPSTRRWDEVQELSDVVAKRLPQTAARMKQLAAEGRWLADTDTLLGRAIRQTPGIYLGFNTLPDTSGSSAETNDLLYKPRLLNADFSSRHAPTPRKLRNAPLPVFIEEASGLGDMSIADANSVLQVRIVSADKDRWLPTLPLLLGVKKAMGHTQSIRIDNHHVEYGDFRLPFDDQGRLLIGFSSGASESGAFPLMTASDVISGKLSWRELQNKIVLIGTPEQPVWSTPAGLLTDRELQAHAITAIVDNHYYSLHPQARWISIALISGIALMLLLLVMRLPLWLSSTLSGFLALSLVGMDVWLLLIRHVWVPVALPLIVLVLGYGLLMIFRLYRDQHLYSQREAAEIRRDLGLLHQQKGNLDKALLVFRHLPADPESLELLYSLGKEFERKRRFHQAVSAYDWILARDAKFKDANIRRDKAHHLDNAGMTGSASGTSSLLIDGMDHKPTLGRYEIDKMIGKGAMGEVYLGRDPSINRVVAIKTLQLASEFAPDELEEVRERFFHEAAAAGNLNHANIVTIYDVGEEHDLAFMAMEYIDGYSLDEYSKPEKLLPIDKVIAYIIQTAKALDYAHQEGIVHRDVKPANLMIVKKKDSVKITDFGIARITSHSRTKTGMLLGTPSYMSPEQAMGHQVDHRADIFSLGTTLFALLTGDKPFHGDSLASLFYQIMNAPHPDIRKLNPKVSDTLKRIIDKALQKDPDKRYQSAGAMARALSRLKVKD
ncbi:MAG TPA: serine/threonine-protein kinase [Mariprofundaceae bacterium]|nr:serine/threonine-protein kinase [Mariprofundaceae bacterium]